MLSTILIIVLILLLIGAIPSWGYSRSWGYFPSGIIGVVLVIVGYRRVVHPDRASDHPLMLGAIGFALVLVSSAALEAIRLWRLPASLPLAPGGALGDAIGHGLSRGVGFNGATLLLLALFAVGTSLLFGVSWLRVMEHIGSGVEALIARARRRRELALERRIGDAPGRRCVEHFRVPCMRVSIMPELSVAIITKDEIERIGPCIESVRAIAAEVVVVDSGSTDGTAALCRQLGAHVLELDWAGYGRQKNRAVRAAKHDWVLSLDADERVTPQLSQAIRAAMAVVISSCRSKSSLRSRS